jgi:signal transduction histidine kinase
MKSSECSGGAQPAGFKTRDGRLWLPTVKGVAVIDPEHIQVNAEKPPVVIEGVRVDEKPMPLQAGLELEAGTQKFEFQYAGLSLVASERVAYRYRLEGFDADWIDAGARRVAYYNSIPPGAYRFRVRACNADGACNEDGAAFAFTRRARFRETWWFGGLGALAILSLGFGVYRLRLRQVKSEFDAVLLERGRISREIHDTLAQGFVGISAQLETVAKLHAVSPELARKHLDRARILVRSSLVEARRSVWDLRPQALERGDLASALADIAQQLTTGTDVRVDVLGEPRGLPPHVENNLFRIGQEALTNAFKHAQAGAIRVELRFDHDTVRLAVNDDGRGFDTQAVLAAEGHFGLVGIRERTQILGGRLSVLSSVGAGSAIVVDVVVPGGSRERAAAAAEAASAQPLRADR